jgi:anti-anti-sigma factor
MEPHTDESDDELNGEPVLVVSAIHTARGVMLSFVGDLDLHGVTQLHERLAEIRADGAPGLLEIDLGRLAFIDSSGLQAVMAVRHDLEEEGTSTRIVSVSPVVARVAEIAGLDDHFQVRDD